MSHLQKLVTTFGPVRLAILVAVAAAALSFFGWVTLKIAEPDYALLYGDLDMSDSARVIARLEASGVPYRLEGGGSVVFVPRDQVARTRVALAEQGVPATGSLGYEIFDKGSALGTTSFVQNVNLIRALEGELARTIRSIAGIRNARVHLVLPKREPFTRHRQDPTASVLIETSSPTSLTVQQVASVQNIIASAVPGLLPHRIAVVDHRGMLLSESKDGGAEPGALMAAKDEERRLRLEARLGRTIEQLLERVVGPGKVRAEVFADVDFDRINTTEERYDPDGQVVRSTRSVEENNVNREAAEARPVTVGANLPDADPFRGSGVDQSSTESRAEELVNYEISKKIINHVREAGVVRKLSVAVLVDGNYVTDDAGNARYEPRSQEELDRLTALVRGAVGFDGDRGDSIEVINLRFADPPVAAVDAPGPLLGLETADIFRMAQLAVLALLGLLVLVFVIRPLLSRALQPGPVAGALGRGWLPQPSSPSALAAPGSVAQGQALALADQAAPDGTIDLNQVEGRVQASSTKRVAEIVEKHPEETLAIVRSWLHAED